MHPKPGQTFRVSVVANTDPLTRRKLERLSDDRGDTTLSYFTREIVTPDDRGVLVASNRSGRWLPYLIHPDQRVMRCLSTITLYDWSSPAIGGDKVVFISRDGRLGFVPLDGGEFEPLIQLPPGFRYSEVAASKCGRYAVLIYSEKPHPPSQRISDGEYPSSLSEQAAFGARWVLLHINLETGITKGLTGGLGSVAHPLISPTNPQQMEYCQSPPWRLCQRMWSVRYYEKAFFVEVEPLFRQRIGLDAVGHEFFLQDGRTAAVWMRFGKVSDPQDSPRESFILVADPETGKQTAYRTTTMIYNHLHGRDGRVFVSEGISGRRGPTRLDLICRYDVRGQQAMATTLCASGCSWSGQLGHPHAVVSRDNRWCYFNSDRDGHCNVYRVRMD